MEGREQQRAVGGCIEEASQAFDAIRARAASRRLTAASKVLIAPLQPEPKDEGAEAAPTEPEAALAGAARVRGACSRRPTCKVFGLPDAPWELEVLEAATEVAVAAGFVVDALRLEAAGDVDAACDEASLVDDELELQSLAQMAATYTEDVTIFPVRAMPPLGRAPPDGALHKPRFQSGGSASSYFAASAPDRPQHRLGPRVAKDGGDEASPPRHSPAFAVGLSGLLVISMDSPRLAEGSGRPQGRCTKPPCTRAKDWHGNLAELNLGSACAGLTFDQHTEACDVGGLESFLGSCPRTESPPMGEGQPPWRSVCSDVAEEGRRPALERRPVRASACGPGRPRAWRPRGVSAGGPRMSGEANPDIA